MKTVHSLRPRDISNRCSSMCKQNTKFSNEQICTSAVTGKNVLRHEAKIHYHDRCWVNANVIRIYYAINVTYITIVKIQNYQIIY